MRTSAKLALCAMTLPFAIAGAQRVPESELGFRAGFSQLSSDNGAGGTDKVNVIAIPGAIFLSPGGVHFMFFLNDKVSLEPQFGFIRSSSSGSSSSLMYLALQPNYFFSAGAQRSGYIFGQVGILRDTDSFGGTSNTDTQNVFGGGIGYRRVLRRVVSTRYEFRFRRFSADGPGGTALDELSVLVGLGVVIPRGGS